MRMRACNDTPHALNGNVMIGATLCKALTDAIQRELDLATRAELARSAALLHENAVLGRELAAAQQRSTRQSAEHASRVEALQRELQSVRNELKRLRAAAQQGIAPPASDAPMSASVRTPVHAPAHRARLTP